MAIKTFNELPELQDLLSKGGRPGFDYALVASKNIVRSQEDGWDMIERVTPFNIVGPLGSCPTILVGRGRSIYGAAPGSSISQLWYDPEISDLTGLWLEGEEPKKEVKVEPAKVETKVPTKSVA